VKIVFLIDESPNFLRYRICHRRHRVSCVVDVVFNHGTYSYSYSGLSESLHNSGTSRQVSCHRIELLYTVGGNKAFFQYLTLSITGNKTPLKLKGRIIENPNAEQIRMSISL
jgi:hypothetical protein